VRLVPVFVLALLVYPAAASAQIEESVSNIKVVLDHIFISRENNSLAISETVVFRNEGAEIYYSRDNHTFFAISTPPDAKNLKAQAMECCLVQEEGVVFMDPMQTIKPGDNFEMQVSYTLAPQGEGYTFNKSALYNTTSLSLFIEKSGMSPLSAYETLTLQGNEYYVIAFNDLKAGENVHVPIKIAEGSNYLYAGIGLIVLFSIISTYLFKEKLFGKKETPEELEQEKRRIFQAIYGFEKHAGKSEEYRRLMEEYRLRAIQVLIKIDKMKNKNEI